MVADTRHATSACVAVALGGAIGATGRYVISLAVTGALGTFIANMAGAFLLGLFATLTAERVPLSPNISRFVTVGILGSFTTFSTFSHHTMELLNDGAILQAAGNSLGSLVLGLVAVAAGVWIARRC